MQDLLGTGSGILIAVSGLIGLALYLWYLAALAQLFPKLGLQSVHGWIPVLNEWKLLGSAGLPGWLALFLLLPPLGIVVLVARTIAMHQIGTRTAAPGWMTAVGFLLPPLWATMTNARFRGMHTDGADAPPRTPQPRTDTEVQSGVDPFLALLAGAPANLKPEAHQGATPNEIGDLPPLSATHQLHDTEAHELPPISTAALAEALGSEPQEPAPSTAHSLAALLSDDSRVDPLGSEIEREYERLAFEEFLAAPATPLSDTIAHEPFSWDAAVQHPGTADQLGNAAAHPPVQGPEPKYLLPQRQPLTQAIPIQRTMPEPTPAPAPTAPPAAPPAPSTPALNLPPLHPVSLRAETNEAAPHTDSATNRVEGAAAQPAPTDAPASPVDALLAELATTAQNAASVRAASPDELTQRTPAPLHGAPDLNFGDFNLDDGSTAVRQPAHSGHPGINSAESNSAEIDSAVSDSAVSDSTDAAEDGVTPQLPSAAEFAWVLALDDGSTVALHPDSILGRAPLSAGTAVAVPVTDLTRTLSKTHARLTFVGRVWIIEDLGSTNGVRLVHPDGSETALAPHTPARATTHLWLGTRRAELKQGRA